MLPPFWRTLHGKIPLLSLDPNKSEKWTVSTPQWTSRKQRDLNGFLVRTFSIKFACPSKTGIYFYLRTIKKIRYITWLRWKHEFTTRYQQWSASRVAYTPIQEKCIALTSKCQRTAAFNRALHEFNPQSVDTFFLSCF